MKDYYRFRFRRPDGGTPKLAMTLQDVVAMTGILAVVIGILVTNSIHDLDSYNFTMITSAMYFWLMAKFSEDYAIVARWLIAIPAVLLAITFTTAFLLTNSPTAADLIAIGVAVAWYIVVAIISLRQLRLLASNNSS